MFLLVAFGLLYSAAAKNIHIAIRENLTQPCPNMKSDIVDSKSIKMSFELIDGQDGSGDQTTITDVNGQSKTIAFPACYRARLSFKLKKSLINPYIESFLQLGQNIPCQAEGKPTGIDSICTNITRTSWCPQSKNDHLRSMLQEKQTCTFCNLCETVTSDTEESRSLQKYVTNEGSDECSTSDDEQTLTFKMCTPSREELNERNEDEREKLDQYWQYLKQGVLTAVIHVMDRKEVEHSRLHQCQQMCDVYENKRSVSDNYKKSLLHSIENLCSPQDTYAACVYHTIKFDINGDFEQ